MASAVIIAMYNANTVLSLKDYQVTIIAMSMEDETVAGGEAPAEEVAAEEEVGEEAA